MISRRSVLAMTAGVMGGPLAGLRVAHAAGARVLVIGAGVAGLAAARDLVAAGAEVTVIEARDRIGGRILTSREWPDVPADLGASWIHGIEGNPISTLADEAGALRALTSYDRAIAFPSSPDLDDAEAVVEQARVEAEEGDNDISLKAAVEASAGWTDATPNERRLIRHYVNATIEQEYGGAWDDVSSWYFDTDAETEGGDVLFPGGYDQIIRHLAQGLDIQLGQKVVRIDPGMRVTLADGTEIAADRVVVTLPLGVLQSGEVTFGAALSPARLQAIQRLKMGLLNKCVLRFDRPYWPQDVDWMEFIGPQDGVWSEWLSLTLATGAPVLIGFNAGAQARAIEALDDRATQASAMAALRAMLGESVPEPLSVQISRWGQDPFSMGAYSFNGVGTTPQMRQDLAGADWDGRLIFAGEACSADSFGTVHGAFLSGVAAAKALL